MFGWLFGGKRRKRKKRSRKLKAAGTRIEAAPPRPKPPATPPKRDPNRIAQRLGGPESIAAVIRTLLKEDNRNRKR